MTLPILDLGLTAVQSIMILVRFVLLGLPHVNLSHFTATQQLRNGTLRTTVTDGKYAITAQLNVVGIAPSCGGKSASSDRGVGRDGGSGSVTDIAAVYGSIVADVTVQCPSGVATAVLNVTLGSDTIFDLPMYRLDEPPTLVKETVSFTCFTVPTNPCTD